MVALEKGSKTANFREQIIRQRLGLQNLINEPVKFEVISLGNKIVVKATGRDFDPHEFLSFHKSENKAYALDGFNVLAIIDHPELDERRDYFAVLRQGYPPSFQADYLQFTKEEIEQIFSHLETADWKDTLTALDCKECPVPLVGAIITNRKGNTFNTKNRNRISNAWIPFSLVNTRYRSRGNRNNPPHLAIFKGEQGILEIEATVKRNSRQLSSLSISYSDTFPEDYQKKIDILRNRYWNGQVGRKTSEDDLKSFAVEVMGALTPLIPKNMPGQSISVWNKRSLWSKPEWISSPDDKEGNANHGYWTSPKMKPPFSRLCSRNDSRIFKSRESDI